MEKLKQFGRETTERTLAERESEVYDMLIGQHDVMRNLPTEDIRSYITEILSEVDRLEVSARQDPALRSVPLELAKSIGAIWTFSGPGTYDEPITDHDTAYDAYPWAHGMDRERLNYTARLARKITEASTGITHPASPATIEAEVQKTKQDIADFGPHIIYNGTPKGNAAVESVLAQEETIIPAENVSVIGEDIKNTIDQLKTFKLPGDLLIEGKKIALVSHAPHFPRIVRMINRYQPFPTGTKIVLFPLATPGDGRDLYAAREACAIIYYTYLSATHDATRIPYPFEVYEPDHDTVIEM
jgi:hypothetical protein